MGCIFEESEITIFERYLHLLCLLQHIHEAKIRKYPKGLPTKDCIIKMWPLPINMP